jgi:gamma-glutamyltranspeptidase/glutathione hydrolase
MEARLGALALLSLLACSDPGNAPLKAPASSASATASAAVPTSSASAAASAAPVEAPEPPPIPAPDPPIALATGGKAAVHATSGVVTSVEAHASKAGAAMLDKGGNAVDAAVAAAFVLAVTHPSAGNLGGGGFMLVRPPSGETVAIDFRELAPAAATQAKNDAQIAAGAVGWLSIAVPGSVAGLALAHEKFGSLPWADVVSPARELAKKGHKLAARQAATIAWSWSKLSKDPEAKRIFGRGKGPKREGELVVQPELSRVLDAIAKGGAKGFYEGWVAEAIARASQRNGGLVTLQDLAGYRAKVRAPLKVGYRGFVVETMPPPSMGGVAVAEMLRVLERTKAHEARPDTGLGLHWFVEASRRAFAERRLVGADPDAREAETREQLTRLLSNAHAHKLASSIDPERATPSSRISLDMALDPFESPETTHLLGGRRAGQRRLVHGHAVCELRREDRPRGDGRGLLQRARRVLARAAQTTQRAASAWRAR